MQRNGTKDASLEAWKEFCVLLNTPCAKSEGAQAFLQQQNLSFLIQQRQPPRAVRVEYSPELKKLRYNAGDSGWRELKSIEDPQKGVMYETPYHHKYTVQQLCELILQEFGKSPF